MLCLYALPVSRLIRYYETLGFRRLDAAGAEFVHGRIKPKYDQGCVFMFRSIRTPLILGRTDPVTTTQNAFASCAIFLRIDIATDLADALVYVVPRGDLAEILFAQPLIRFSAQTPLRFGIIRHAVCGDEDQSQKAGNFGFQMEGVGGYELYDDN